MKIVFQNFITFQDFRLFICNYQIKSVIDDVK